MMKISKRESVVILIAALFLAFCAGWFFRGQSQARPLSIETQRTMDRAPAALPAPTVGKVDINSASAEELMTLPGIGEKRAADIIADREANGPYHSPSDLLRVPGIGQEILKGLLDYITTGE